jgi:hypothetical protein
MDENSEFMKNLNNIPMPNIVSQLAATVQVRPDVSRLNPAEWAYNRLVEYIKEFEKGLDEEHEIGARLVSFGSNFTFHIQDMGYYGPDIITFYGQDDKGQDVQLIQNISQLNVLLIALKKLQDKPRRLGFILDKKETKE